MKLKFLIDIITDKIEDLKEISCKQFISVCAIELWRARTKAILDKDSMSRI